MGFIIIVEKKIVYETYYFSSRILEKITFDNSTISQNTGFLPRNLCFKTPITKCLGGVKALPALPVHTPMV